jgi:hypothetical protein
MSSPVGFLQRIVIRKINKKETYAEGENSLPEVGAGAISVGRTGGIMRRYHLG